jgi:hypothetical protein
VETLAPNISTGESALTAVPADIPHGIEVGVEFKPLEHPVEPLSLDQLLKCLLPEPSILHVSHLSAFISNCASEAHHLTQSFKRTILLANFRSLQYSSL